jgi:hypothetical protein
MQGGSSSTKCRILVSYSKLTEQFFVASKLPRLQFSLPLRYEVEAKSFLIDYQAHALKCHLDIKSFFTVLAKNLDKHYGLGRLKRH